MVILLTAKPNAQIICYVFCREAKSQELKGHGLLSVVNGKKLICFRQVTFTTKA